MADTNLTSKSKPKALGKLAKEIGKRKPFDSPEVEVFVSLMRTVDLLSVEGTELLAKHDLSGQLYNALRIVGGQQKVSPEGITIGTISQQMVCRHPDTTRLVDRLEALGYVIRVQSTEDARKRLVSITNKGEDVLQAIHRPIRELHRRQFASLTPKMLDQLGKLLQTIRDGLEDTKVVKKEE